MTENDYPKTDPANVFRCAAFLVLIVALPALSGCNLRRDAIGVSNTIIEFGLNETPFPLYVWNVREGIAELRIRAQSNAPWLLVSPAEAVSRRPSGDVYDKRSIIVRIDRTQLDEGTHEGLITLKADVGKEKEVVVRVLMDRDGRLSKLNIVNPVTTYSRPYLMDFVFALRDDANKAVVAEPAQFEIIAFEDDGIVRPLDTGLALHRSPDRRMLVDFVLDYSLSMQESSSAIAALENVVRNDILHGLNPEARVGITVFSREDKPPVVVADFDDSHARIRENLAAIRQEHVGRYTAGSIMFDALMTALDKFVAGDPLQESRHIFLVSDGYDSSSRTSIDDVVNKARDLFVTIQVVGIEEEPHLVNLLSLAGRTGGAYFSEIDEGDTIGPFVRGLSRNITGQYRLRWATARRSNHAFLPAFQIEIGPNRAAYAAPRRYLPEWYAGNVLRGVIGVAPMDNPLRAGYLFSMEYAPRLVKDLRIRLAIETPYSVRIIEAADGGLLSLWNFEHSDSEAGGAWLDFFSNGQTLPFAGFGPLFAIEFDGVFPEGPPEIDLIEIDNTLYADDIFFVIRMR